MPEARGKGTLIEAMPGPGLFLRMLTKAGAPVDRLASTKKKSISS